MGNNLPEPVMLSELTESCQEIMKACGDAKVVVCLGKNNAKGSCFMQMVGLSYTMNPVTCTADRYVIEIQPMKVVEKENGLFLIRETN